MAEIAILGAGVMGSAMAMPAAAAGHRVRLVGTHLDGDVVRSIAGNGHHPGLKVAMPEDAQVLPATAFDAVMADKPDLLILGVSSAGVDWAVERIGEAVRTPIPVLMITKGLTASDRGIEVLPERVRREVKARFGLDLPVMAVGGPCIAGELAARRHTDVVMTGADPALLESTAALFAVDFYHVSRSSDVVGVEVCAAFKNFFALGVGTAAGRLEREGKGVNGALMFNPAAALFTQALAEMTVLVEALGGRRDTVAGLAGAGDLYVTCMAGRNSRMGRLLGLGHTYGEAKAGPMAGDTVEGAELARTLGPTLRLMMADGRLPATHLPLTLSILNAVCDDLPFDADWRKTLAESPMASS